MDLIQKAKALCLSACLEAVIAIICICAYAIAVDVLQISQYSTLTRICCIIGMVSVMGRDGILFKHLSKLRNISLHREIGNTQKSIYCKSNTQSDELLCLVTQ